MASRVAISKLSQESARHWGLGALIAVLLVLPVQARNSPVRELPRANPSPRYEVSYAAGADSAFGAEDLRYEFGWQGYPAATAQWIASREVREDGPVLIVRAQAHTLPRIDRLWKMRSEIEASLAIDPIVPTRFVLRDRAERGRTDTVVFAFDHDLGQIDIRRERTGRSTRVRSERIEGQYDPVSAAFLLRSLPMEPGSPHEVVIQTRKDRYRLELAVVGRERVTVKAGTFDAVVLAPRLRDAASDEAVFWLRKARLWVTDDDRRVILRLDSSVFVGRVYAELASFASDPPEVLRVD